MDNLYSFEECPYCGSRNFHPNSCTMRITDKQVHEVIFGYKFSKGIPCPEKAYEDANFPNYCSKFEHIWKVIEKMNNLGYYFILNNGNICSAMFINKVDDKGCMGYGRGMFEAICNAALNIYKSKDRDVDFGDKNEFKNFAINE